KRTRLIVLALADRALPAPDAVCAAYVENFPEAGPLRIDAQRTSADTLALRSPNTTFFIGLMPAPLPPAELADPASAAWYWPEAAATLKPHRAHAVVSAESETLDPIDLMLTLSRVVAALAVSAPSLGVYVGGAKLVHKVDDFVSETITATREQLPLYLWLRFDLAEASYRSLANEPRTSTPGALSLLTTGLTQFELMELEFAPSLLDPQTLMDRAFNIAHYLLDHGAVLSDGHTIGTSADERFRVRHGASIRPGHDPVYRIEVQNWEQQIPQA
ncbi:MAG: hypothetical protein RLZZ450_7255, partial [Pseudomonadota bacterium]